MPFPLAVNATGGSVAASSAALGGLIELRTGRGRGDVAGNCINENWMRFEFVPEPVPETVMATAAAPVASDAVSAAEIAAVICVALTNVVGRGEPFQFTTRPGAKPVPFTVSVKPVALQYGVLFALVVEAETDVTMASEMGKGKGAEGFALDAGLATVI